MQKINISNRIKGVLFIITATFCFASMAVFVRFAGDLPSMQKCIFRNMIALIFASGALLRSHTRLHIEKDTIKPYLGRCILGTMSVVGNYYAIDHLLLADSAVLGKISPFFALLFSSIILKDKIRKKQWIALFVAFVGVLLVVKPSFENVLIVPYIIGLIGGAAGGVSHVYLRILGQRVKNKFEIVFMFSLFSTVVVFPFAAIGYVPMTLRQVVFLLIGGSLAAMGQFALTTAYSYAPPKQISVFDYTQVIFSAMWGLLLFSQIPDIYSIIGYIVVCVASIINFISSNEDEEK